MARANPRRLSKFNKCKSRTARQLFKKAKSPARRKTVLARAAKKCGQKKVLRQYSPPKRVEATPMRAMFAIKDIQPERYQKSGFGKMDKPFKAYSDLFVMIREMISMYSRCGDDMCMVTSVRIENEDDKTVAAYNFTGPEISMPETGKYFIHLNLAPIPDSLLTTLDDYVKEIKEEDCEGVDTATDANRQRIAKMYRQQWPSTLLDKAMTTLDKTEVQKKEECRQLGIDV